MVREETTLKDLLKEGYIIKKNEDIAQTQPILDMTCPECGAYLQGFDKDIVCTECDYEVPNDELDSAWRQLHIKECAK